MTYRLGGGRSIQLSYQGIALKSRICILEGLKNITRCKIGTDKLTLNIAYSILLRKPINDEEMIIEMTRPFCLSSKVNLSVPL